MRIERRGLDNEERKRKREREGRDTYERGEETSGSLV
jgi:hypothetical protein